MDKYKYRGASLNYVTGNILIVAHNNQVSQKNVSMTRIQQLKEIPAQLQIDVLLDMGKIPEAKDIFMLKVNKSDPQFSKKSD